MNVAGVEKCSLVDWPGKMAAVVFAPGCNLRCHYCHNRATLCESPVLLDRDAVLALLYERRGFLDGVVISGGEPTLQLGLTTFIDSVRAMGYPVKLDTNGTRPRVLQSLLETERLDFVAMDVKAPRHRYDEVCGVSVDQDAIDESIDLILRSGVAHEFRTTVLPDFTEEDILDIVERVSGAERYVLQPYRSSEGSQSLEA
ncbi:MAG: anaerobic ribonucleoside-triphosphate reductase activating protein, partial [Candidatus Hydrogenedentes bacterium]|nr:anaerobic ribonucleoside-triphosphate reductase activating protein [Candidatus Hydrogenedentota bacterium]